VAELPASRFVAGSPGKDGSAVTKPASSGYFLSARATAETLPALALSAKLASIVGTNPAAAKEARIRRNITASCSLREARY
jgi:hypothetical protein